MLTDIGIADEETLLGSFSISCLFNTWWGWWGPWYRKCSYSKQFGKLLELWQAQIQTLQLLSYQEAREANPNHFEVDQSVRGMTFALNLCIKNSRCRGVLKRHPWWRDTAKCMKAFVSHPQGIKGRFRWCLLEQHIQYVGPHTRAGSIQG